MIKDDKRLKRIRRHKRARAKIFGTAQRPRVSVFKSNRWLNVQIIDDQKGRTIISIGDKALLKEGKEGNRKTKRDRARELGRMLAEKAQKANIESVVFDKGGYKYHGRIRELAEGLREGGLKF